MSAVGVPTLSPSARFSAAEINRYDHGGGRVFYTNPDGTRELIADLYREDTREFVISACSSHVALLSERDLLANALEECANRFERCIVHSGSDKEIAAQAVEAYRHMVASARGGK